jgi:hypothetical protein
MMACATKLLVFVMVADAKAAAATLAAKEQVAIASGIHKGSKTEELQARAAEPHIQPVSKAGEHHAPTHHIQPVSKAGHDQERVPNIKITKAEQGNVATSSLKIDPTLTEDFAGYPLQESEFEGYNPGVYRTENGCGEFTVVDNTTTRTARRMNYPNGTKCTLKFYADSRPYSSICISGECVTLPEMACFGKRENATCGGFRGEVRLDMSCYPEEMRRTNPTPCATEYQNFAPDSLRCTWYEGPNLMNVRNPIFRPPVLPHHLLCDPRTCSDYTTSCLTPVDYAQGDPDFSCFSATASVACRVATATAVVVVVVVVVVTVVALRM